VWLVQTLEQYGELDPPPGLFKGQTNLDLDTRAVPWTTSRRNSKPHKAIAPEFRPDAQTEMSFMAMPDSAWRFPPDAAAAA